jgi:hypothetical protein
MLCVICTMHLGTRTVGFLVEPQNQDRRFVSGLASKPLGRFVSGLASKPLGRFVSGLASKPLGRVVSGLVSIPLRWFSPVWPPNRCCQFCGPNRETLHHIGFEPEQRNPTPFFEAKPGETDTTGFESKPEKIVATSFEAKPEKSITTGFEVKPKKTIPVVLRPNH